MASTRKIERKDGTTAYEIRCRVSRDRPELSMRWEVPAGWSKRAIERELARVSAEFERKCKDGEIKSRSELHEEAAERAAAEARVLTVRKFAETVFMPRKAAVCAENTRAFYQAQFDNHIFPAFGDCRLPDVTTAQIDALLLDMLRDGRSLSTRVAVYVTLSQLFKSAYMADLTEKNVMDKIERPKVSKDIAKKEAPPSLAVDELKRIIALLDEEPLVWRTFFRLMIDCGARRGEILAIRWKNVNFEKNQIEIRSTLNYTKEKGIYENSPKNGYSRIVPVSPAVMKLLRLLRQEQAQSCISPYVFSQDGKAEPLFPTSPTRWLTQFCKRHDLPPLHPHIFRHSFISTALVSGADLVSVSEIVGHSTPAVTLKMYSHANTESKKKAAEIFQAAVAGTL